MHWFAYLKDAPQYGKASNNEIASYYDKIISCSSDVKPEHHQFLEYQLHQHVKSCRIGNRQICKYGFPVPPMNKSRVLEPIQLDSKEEAIFKEKWCKIQKYLKKLGMGLDVTTTFEEMLSELNITNDEYIKAVQCSLV